MNCSESQCVTEDCAKSQQYGPVEGYPHHSDISIMTITMVGHFNGTINDIKQAFYLLPVTKVPVRVPLRPVQKIKLDHPGISGLIMSCKHGKKIRGIVRSIPKGTWDNSVMIDISITEKNINAKLSRTNIQMCGCKSIEMGVETTHILIDHINLIQEGLDSIDKYPQIFAEVCSDILKEGQTGLIQIEKDQFTVGFNVLKISSHDDDDENRARIRKFLFMELTDVFTLNDARLKLDWISQQKNIIDQPLEYSDSRVGMFKYRFKIGFHVDQAKLSRLFPQIDPGFYTDYFPDVRNYVKIEIPCDSNEKKSGPDVKKHTFSVQQTGQTTHSCPVQVEMEQVYYRFIGVIAAIRSEIEVIPH